jgi:hypothetical protein
MPYCRRYLFGGNNPPIGKMHVFSALLLKNLWPQMTVEMIQHFVIIAEIVPYEDGWPGV